MDVFKINGADDDDDDDNRTVLEIAWGSGLPTVHKFTDSPKNLTQIDLSVKVRKNIRMSVKNEKLSSKLLKWKKREISVFVISS